MAHQNKVLNFTLSSPEKKKASKRKMWARLCYHYPQYTFDDASKLPHYLVKLLLETAHQEKNKEYYNILSCTSAPQFKDQTKKLLKFYEKESQ